MSLFSFKKIYEALKLIKYKLSNCEINNKAVQFKKISKWPFVYNMIKHVIIYNKMIMKNYISIANDIIKLKLESNIKSVA